MTTEAAALKCYNSLFDNAQYQRVTQTIADDLKVERESVTGSDAANLITDAALGLSGHPSYAEAWHTLASFCGRNNIHSQTIGDVHQYLARFQQLGDTRADDFEATAKALYHLQALKSHLHPAICHTNGIHSWRGRMAYDLLASAGYVVQVAQALLADDNESYVAEKLQSGLRRITGALHEGVRHSERPEMFDFSEIVSPLHSDGK